MSTIASTIASSSERRARPARQAEAASITLATSESQYICAVTLPPTGRTLLPPKAEQYVV